MHNFWATFLLFGSVYINPWDPCLPPLWFVVRSGYLDCVFHHSKISYLPGFVIINVLLPQFLVLSVNDTWLWSIVCSTTMTCTYQILNFTYVFLGRRWNKKNIIVNSCGCSEMLEKFSLCLYSVQQLLNYPWCEQLANQASTPLYRLWCR